MSASVVSIKILQVVNRDGPRIQGLDIIVRLSPPRSRDPAQRNSTYNYGNCGKTRRNPNIPVSALGRPHGQWQFASVLGDNLSAVDSTGRLDHWCFQEIVRTLSSLDMKKPMEPRPFNSDHCSSIVVARDL
jgi:hypothetical protein